MDTYFEQITVQSSIEKKLAKLKSEKGRRGSKWSMNLVMRKVKSKGRATTTSKLKSRGKLRAKKTGSRIKPAANTRSKTVIAKTKAKSTRESTGKRIVRIMGQGQYVVGDKILRKLNGIDNDMVELVGRERSDDLEFKKKLTEMSDMVIKNGKPLDPKEIIKSDIILPSVDLSIDEAKRLFKGEGVIPEI